MKNKRVLAAIMSAVILGACVFGGCGTNDSDKSGGSGNVTEPENKTEQDAGKDTESKDAAQNQSYVFVSNGVEIAVDMDMSAIVGQLGEIANYFEEPSCAAEGIAKIYSYSGYEINTYPDGDRDLIGTITLKDDSVATPEGIDLSMTKDDVIAAYGSGYKETDTSLVYEKGGAKLVFILDGENIISIEYASSVLN